MEGGEGRGAKGGEAAAARSCRHGEKQVVGGILPSKIR